MQLLFASTSAFDVKAALVAGHAQHPVIIHFPIALFIASVTFELLAVWRRQPAFAQVAWYNLFGATLSLPFAVASGLGAWHWQLDGAALKGNLLLHLICALTSALLITILCSVRSRLRAQGRSPRFAYFTLAAVAFGIVALTGHLGGFVSGVEGP